MHPFAELQIPPDSLGIHWFEQNAFALKDAQGTVLLTDPYFPTKRPAERFVRPTPPVDLAQFPADYVLLTHRHGDHTHPETLTRLHAAWPEVICIGPHESVAQIVAETPIDLAHCRVIAAGETLSIGTVTLHAFYSKPPEGDPAAGIKSPDVTHLGYVIEIGGKKVYITGDAINTLAEHDEMLAPIAALEPEIGLLTMHPTEGEFPFFEDGVLLAQKLGLQIAVPSHYACFAKRTYNPQVWADMLPKEGPQPLVIPWNSSRILE